MLLCDETPWSLLLVLVGLPCATVLVVTLVQWRLMHLWLAAHQRSTDAMLSELTARSQVVSAQNSEMLRRLEAME